MHCRTGRDGRWSRFDGRGAHAFASDNAAAFVRLVLSGGGMKVEVVAAARFGIDGQLFLGQQGGGGFVVCRFDGVLVTQEEVVDAPSAGLGVSRRQRGVAWKINRHIYSFYGTIFIYRCPSG